MDWLFDATGTQDAPGLLEAWQGFSYVNTRFLPKHKSLLKQL